MLKKMNPAREYFFDEGCFINELNNDGSDAVLSIAQARVEPGKTTRWHRLHDTTERYVIVSGNGRVEIGNEVAQTVGIGDCVIIPPLCRQRITNTGADDLIFLAICSPPFTRECYEDLEQH